MSAHWTESLELLGACDGAVAWARGYDSLAAAWAACERGDWMLWLAGRCAGEPWSDARRPLVGAAGECAGQAPQRHPAAAVCVRWARREATDDELRDAGDAADADADADARAATVAYDAVRAANAAYVAANAAATVADADARAATVAYVAAAANVADAATIVRRWYPSPPVLR